MGCNDKHSNSKNIGCVCDVVKFIAELQSACDDFTCTANCLNPMLGMPSSGTKANTRVFSLYTEDGTLFDVEFLTTSCTRDSSEFFRVESVDECCAVLRVLKLQDGSMGMCKFENTDQCIVCDLNRFIAIACVEDTFIAGV